MFVLRNVRRRLVPVSLPFSFHYTNRKLTPSVRISFHSRSSSTKLPQSIIVGSCSHQTENLSYWDRFVRLKPDLVILGGDNVYGGKNLDTLQHAYKELKDNASFQNALKAQFHILATLDDNDYGNSGDACESNPNKEEAKNMFLEFFHVPRNDPRWCRNRGAYTSYQWETRLQIILLDLRYNMSPFLVTGDPNSSAQYVPDYADKSKTILGIEQWSWLEQELEKPTQVRLVVSPLQVLADGHGFECWGMLPYERDRLLNLLHQSKGTTIIVSGDRHASALYRQADLVEVTSSSLTHTIGSGMLDNETDSWRVGDFIYSNNFGMIQFDWDEKIVMIAIHDALTGLVVENWSFPMKQQ